MRPIDADALCEGRVSNDPVVIAAKCEPTLDYAPVRHGKWILYSFPPHHVTVDGYMICTKCDHCFYRIKGKWFKRCPECGCLMTGGKKDG